MPSQIFQDSCPTLDLIQHKIIFFEFAKIHGKTLDFGSQKSKSNRYYKDKVIDT